MLVQGAPFEFDDQCLKAILFLKQKLVSAPIIVAPDWNFPFELMCDASDYAIGAVLGQKRERTFQVIDECLKHSYYTRVGLSFSRLFYINYVVFVVRSLIWCLVWMQVYWSEKSSCWKHVLEQWGSEQGSDCHVATLQRRDVSSRSAPYNLKYEWFRNRGIERGTNEGTEFQSRVT